MNSIFKESFKIMDPTIDFRLSCILRKKLHDDQIKEIMIFIRLKAIILQPLQYFLTYQNLIIVSGPGL